MTFHRSYWFYKYKNTGTINGVNDMTKMIGNVETKRFPIWNGALMRWMIFLVKISKSCLRW